MRVKRPEREAGNVHKYVVEIKNTWLYSFTPPYAFVIRDVLN